MKNILVINGSPNIHGNTSKILEKILDGIEVGRYNIINVDCYKLNINPCIDCKFCSKVESCCSIKDDMEEIYKYIKEADIVILASPMYFGMFPSTVKALIDRCQVIWSEKFIHRMNSYKHKVGILVFDAGSKWNNMFLPMETISRYFFNTINCDIEYKLYISNTDKNKDLRLYSSEIENCKQIINKELMIN